MTDETSTAPAAPAAGASTGGGARRPFFRRRKVCPFSGAGATATPAQGEGAAGSAGELAAAVPVVSNRRSSGGTPVVS